MDAILKRLGEIKAEAETLRESDDPNRIERLRELLAERKELQVKFEEETALAELTAEVPEAPVAVEPEVKPVVELVPDPVVEPVAVEPAVEPVVEVVPEKVPVAAAASAAKPVDTEVPADGKPEQHTALVASGNVGGTNPGATLTFNDFNRIHRHVKHANPGKGEMKTIYASMAIGNSDSVITEGNSPEQNTAIMASAKPGSFKPITAAAAFCGPDDIVLDICAAGTAARPVQGLFRTVPVRGKFRYMKTATLADTAAGVDIFTEADQIALDPSDPASWKPCVDLTCRAETLVTPYAVTSCVKMGTWQQLSAPEQVANWLLQQDKQYSVIAERNLLDRIRAQSHVFSAGATAQGLWTILQALLAHVEAYVGNQNRDTTEGYTLVAPYGFTAALAADEGMRGFSQNLAVNRIQAILRENYGISIVEVWERDSTVTAADPLTLPGLGGAATVFDLGTHSYSTYPLYILNTDAFVAGSSDVVEAGYHRDANLVRQNLVQWFYEGMEFLEKTCDHLSFVFELNTCPNGAGAPVGNDIVCTDPL